MPDCAANRLPISMLPSELGGKSAWQLTVPGIIGAKLSFGTWVSGVSGGV